MPVQREVTVIGGGAAGIMAAWHAASLGANVTIYEKTDRLGTKILISGGGKCNLAHDGPLEDVIRAFEPNEARFIRPACYRLTNHDIVGLFTSKGLDVYTRPNGRVFPTHGTAKDVVSILRTYLLEAGVKICFESPVEAINAEAGRIQSIQVKGSVLPVSRLVVSVGGCSYPGTGTTGDGYAWCRKLGHTVVPIRSALAPVELEIESFATYAGLALRDITLKARLGSKEIARWRDDVLFTHRGISGPTVLGISRKIDEHFKEPRPTVEVDICPDFTFESLSEALKDFSSQNPKKRVHTFVEQWVPSRLVPEILASAGLPIEATCSPMSQKQKNRLVETLKGWSLGPVKRVMLEKGEVVAGGVSLDEVDPQTLQSKKVSGLFLCGELLDIAGPVGGYNLQAAFATGYVSGESAVKLEL